MSKVLITFLGTGQVDRSGKSMGKYVNANYRFNENGKEYKCPFVAAAIYEEYKIDKLIVLGTMKSMWDELYYYFGQKKESYDGDFCLEIYDICKNNNHQSSLKMEFLEKIEHTLGNNTKIIPLKYGLNDAEIEENSNIILSLEQYLQAGDEVVIDITHSFRSLPMYLMNLLIYLRDVSKKNIKISHICYGMLEMSRELEYSPVIDLKNILTINSWISGAYSFKEFGNAYKIAGILSDTDQSLSSRLIKFSNIKNLNHLVALENQCSGTELNAVLTNNNMPQIAKLLIQPIIKEFLNEFKFSGDGIYKHSEFQFKLAKWQKENYNFTAAYMSLNEAVITRYCEFTNRNALLKEEREAAKKEMFDKKNEFSELYRKISENRNALAHCIGTKWGGMKNSPEKMIRDLDIFMKEYTENLC